MDYECVRCEMKIKGNWNLANKPRRPLCPKCDRQGRSNLEIMLSDLLDSYNINYIKNDRKIIAPYELDIVIPEKKIAIEANGLFWHGACTLEQLYKLDKNYHKRKYHLAKEKGYDLMQFWEHQILRQWDIVKSIILSRFGIYDNIVYARDCSVVKIDYGTYKTFLEENHVGGDAPAKIRYGLMHQELDLVSIMGVSKSRFTKGERVYEVIRFCNKLDTKVTGALSRLTSHILYDHPEIERLISYVDLCMFNASGYKQAGYKIMGETGPGYFYANLDIGDTFNRLTFQKHKLKDLFEQGILELYDEDLTEVEKDFNCGPFNSLSEVRSKINDIATKESGIISFLS